MARGTQRRNRAPSTLFGQRTYPASAFLQPPTVRARQPTVVRPRQPAVPWQQSEVRQPANALAAAFWTAAAAEVPTVSEDLPRRPLRPQNPFGIFFGEIRGDLTEEAGTKRVSVLGTLAGERWRALSDAQRAPFQAKYAEAKALYDKEVEEFLAAGGKLGKGKRKTPRDPLEPAKPLSAYMTWISEHRSALVKEAGSASTPAIMKVAARKWKAMTDKMRAVYDQKSKEQLIAYAQAMKEFEARGGTVNPKLKAKLEAIDKPKQPPSAYMIWLNEHRAEFRQELDPNMGKASMEVLRIASQRWSEMTATDKYPYQAKANDRKREYMSLLEEYNRRKASS